MESQAKEDKCRVCNGNGQNCRTITGKFTGVGDGKWYSNHHGNDTFKACVNLRFLLKGYKEFLVIPSSATNIVISEDESVSHFLGKRFKPSINNILNVHKYHLISLYFFSSRRLQG
jgi:hypothetical protein